jgi:hypothetical protein
MPGEPSSGRQRVTPDMRCHVSRTSRAIHVDYGLAGETVLLEARGCCPRLGVPPRVRRRGARDPNPSCIPSAPNALADVPTAPARLTPTETPSGRRATTRPRRFDVEGRPVVEAPQVVCRMGAPRHTPRINKGSSAPRSRRQAGLAGVPHPVVVHVPPSHAD